METGNAGLHCCWHLRRRACLPQKNLFSKRISGRMRKGRSSTIFLRINRGKSLGKTFRSWIRQLEKRQNSRPLPETGSNFPQRRNSKLRMNLRLPHGSMPRNCRLRTPKETDAAAASSAAAGGFTVSSRRRVRSTAMRNSSIR